jgi:predicted amidohydrolase YtcJ
VLGLDLGAKTRTISSLKNLAMAERRSDQEGAMFRNGSRLIIGLLTSVSVAMPSVAQERSADNGLILHNGKIVTQDAADRTVSALAAFGDEIAVTGSDQEVLALRRRGTCVIDLGGRTLVPGFADGHLHSKTPDMDPSRVNLTPVKTMGELLAAIQSKAAASKPGDVIVTNSDWHEGQLQEKRLPNRWDLDPVSPNNPVVVIRGGHQYILNSAALSKWNITKATNPPRGGHITIDKERDDVNGELVDRARDLVELPKAAPRNLEQRLALLRQEQAHYNKLGLTSVRNPGASIEDMHDYHALARRGEMTARTSVLIRWDRKSSAADFRKQLETWPVKSGFGDKWLRLDGIKLGVDGGYEGGWMTKPYAEPHGHGGTYFGLNTVPRQQFIEVVNMLNELDLRPSTHAVGDAAVDLVLDAYEQADRQTDINNRRWVIEHAFITRPDQIERVRRLGLVLSAQSHLYLAGPSLLSFWGRERAEAVAPVRSWLQKGIHVAGGTDNKLPYVPEAPLTTFYHWVTRDTAGAGVLGPSERISRKEALRIATMENAYLTFEESMKGTLEPGKLADLVILSQDIMTVPDERLPETRVLATMVGGRFVYRASDFAANCS